MLKKKEIQIYISELVNLITHDFVNKEGLISATYPPSKENILSHLDDVFPFLLHFDFHRSFLKSQILKSRRYTRHGLILSNGRIVSYCNDEYLGALFAYYQKYKEKWVYKLILESLAGIKDFLVRENVLCTFYDVDLNKNTPLVSSPLTGALIEVLIENRNLLGQKKFWVDRVVKYSLEEWLKCNFFKEYSLFPSKIFLKNEFKNKIFSRVNFPLPSRIKKLSGSTFYYATDYKKRIANFLYEAPIGEKVQCMKENTNLVFCLIEAYKTYKEQKYKEGVEKWIEGLKRNLYKENFVYKFWAPGKNPRIIELTQNFSVIDILSDTYKFVSKKREYLDLAEKIVERWINEMWGINLVPRFPGAFYNHLDEQTDFCISLMRLYELTGKRKYQEIAQNIFEAVLKFHRATHGYISSVTNKGKPLNLDISPKYNSLLLKAFILFMEGGGIYKSHYLHNLMKDR